MRHTTLYRKWRPRRFGEIAGQGSIVRTLRRAIETDRVAHAYLLSGPRGTGKTSSAKVLSMGLNCVNGPTPEPCGECDSCRAIVNNSSMDVVEMDAASNRGIDEIRDLRDRVNLAPVGGRTKVYIIDEVHMLTTEAFNALLKTLEEPPEHVIFVLATTDKHKVPATIISRCQSFDFRRPSVETLSEKLGEIAEAEGIETEPEALTVIARAGGGSFRDAEGLLDQLSSFSEGKVTAALVRELLGNVGPEALLGTVDALAERRVADALRDLDGLSNEGRDLGQFAAELISHLRNLMLLPHAPEVALAEVGADEREPLESQSERIPTAEAVRMIEALGEAVGRIKRGGDAKLELELCFMKLARDYSEPSVESLMSRLESLEMAAGNGGFASAPPREPSKSAATGKPTAEREKGDERGADSAGSSSEKTSSDEESDGAEPGSGRVDAASGASGDRIEEADFGSDVPDAIESEGFPEGGEPDREAETTPSRTEGESVPESESGDSGSEGSGSEPRGDPGAARETVVPAASSGSSGAGVDIASRWPDVMAELKRRRQALTAAVYGEARVAGFDGEVLEIVFPGDGGFHVKMAQERKHLDHLTEVLEAKFGVKPRLEVSSEGGASGSTNAPPRPADGVVREEAPPMDEPPPDEPPSKYDPPPREAPPREPPPIASIPDEPEDEPPMPEMEMESAEDSFADGGTSTPGVENGDDIIRDQREVFDMAQSRFDLDDETKGN